MIAAHRKGRHSPSPWSARYGAAGLIEVFDELGFVVATCGRTDSTVARANSRLIAAAPDLLEAIEAALDLFQKDHALDHFNWAKSALRAEDIRELNELPLKLRKAVAKAAVIWNNTEGRL